MGYLLSIQALFHVFLENKESYSVLVFQPSTALVELTIRKAVAQ